MAALQKESNMSLDDLIKTLPPEMFSEDAEKMEDRDSSVCIILLVYDDSIAVKLFFLIFIFVD